MVHYIVQIAQGIIDLMDDAEKGMASGADSTERSNRLRTVVPQCGVLVEELRRLDPRDFLNASRYEFVIARLNIESWGHQWSPGATGPFVNAFHQDQKFRAELKDLLSRVIAVLDKYGGEGWRAATRRFTFVKDTVLRDIIERDYKELALVLFPGGAWKSTVIMAGSILEAVLFDQLETDPARKAKALTDPDAFKIKGMVQDLEKWNLESLIKVATNLSLIPRERAKTFDHVLRDYRNFVHPKKEVKAKHPCREGEAQLAFGALNALCDIL
jgi:hypothetical protein